MNRRELKRLTYLRLADADVLLRNKRYAGAYYLAGYAVEYAIKARITRRVRLSDMPEKQLVLDFYTHRLADLVKVAGLQQELKQKIADSRDFRRNWLLVQDWSPDSRYAVPSRSSALNLYNAISDRKDGVLPWLQQYW